MLDIILAAALTMSTPADEHAEALRFDRIRTRVATVSEADRTYVARVVIPPPAPDTPAGFEDAAAAAPQRIADAIDQAGPAPGVDTVEADGIIHVDTLTGEAGQDPYVLLADDFGGFIWVRPDGTTAGRTDTDDVTPLLDDFVADDPTSGEAGEVIVLESETLAIEMGFGDDAPHAVAGE